MHALLVRHDKSTGETRRGPDFIGQTVSGRQVGEDLFDLLADDAKRDTKKIELIAKGLAAEYPSIPTGRNRDNFVEQVKIGALLVAVAAQPRGPRWTAVGHDQLNFADAIALGKGTARDLTDQGVPATDIWEVAHTIANQEPQLPAQLGAAYGVGVRAGMLTMKEVAV